MKRTASLLLLLAVAACAGGSDRPPLPVAKGPWVPLNAAHWGTGENDLVRPAPRSALNVAERR